VPKRNKTPAGASSSSSSSSFDDKSQREVLLWGAKGGCFFGKVPSRVSLLGSVGYVVVVSECRE
jgi:hypothetical protein